MSRIYTALQQPKTMGAQSPATASVATRLAASGPSNPPEHLRVVPGGADTSSLLGPSQPARFSAWAPVDACHLPVAVEQYRRLAGHLVRAQEVQGTKVVMLASAASDEGKSVTAANLALTLSKSYRRNVLLIDADLRRPSLHEVFDVPNGGGLSELLARGRLARVAPVEVFPLLTLLPAGRPNPDPVGALTSPLMRRLIEEASSWFDWVIIDTPPLVPLPDAGLLAAMVDAVLLVIRAGSTRHETVLRAIRALGRERILGAILNRATEGIFGHAHARVR
jgi:capsular exopolysaccharide synthesis family protein